MGARFRLDLHENRRVDDSATAGNELTRFAHLAWGHSDVGLLIAASDRNEAAVLRTGTRSEIEYPYDKPE